MAVSRNWKAYQRKLQRQALLKRILTAGTWIVLPLALILAVARLSSVDFSLGSFTKAAANNPPLEAFEKHDFWQLDLPHFFSNSPPSEISVMHQEDRYRLETTIDNGLQEYMTDRLLSAKTPAVAFVAMHPTTGEVLSLVAHSTLNDEGDICLDAGFPAASLFKIVSAAAAIEEHDYSAESRLSYNGKKHTLYKSQLKERKNRYTQYVTLKEAFAKSINPTFGKLGKNQLQKGSLSDFAARFGFNEIIAFELPVEPSGFYVGEDPYQWAEIASGFNRTTVISPVHGAMIAAAVLNGGKLIEPTIIKQMTDENNEIVYRANPHMIRQSISQKTSEELKKLMVETISRGTSRRTFRGHRHDRVLSKLVIGGKTGSIKNKTDDLLYDWFIGFGAEKNGHRQLALAVLVVHGKLLRARAQEFARLAIQSYFRKPSGISS